MLETENSVSATNWQTMKPSIKERIKFMLNNDLFSDVKFLVFDEMNESKQASKQYQLTGLCFRLVVLYLKQCSTVS